MIYFKEHYVTVEYDESLKLVEVEWHGLVLSHHYRETLEMVLDLIEEMKLENFLVNRQNMHRIRLSDERWRQEDWYPRFLKSSIKRSASVISNDFYNEVSLSRLIEENEAEIRIERRSFLDYKAAKDWLLQSVYIEDKILGLDYETIKTKSNSIFFKRELSNRKRI